MIGHFVVNLEWLDTRMSNIHYTCHECKNYAFVTVTHIMVIGRGAANRKCNPLNYANEFCIITVLFFGGGEGKKIKNSYVSL